MKFKYKVVEYFAEPHRYKDVLSGKVTIISHQQKNNIWTVKMVDFDDSCPHFSRGHNHLRVHDKFQTFKHNDSLFTKVYNRALQFNNIFYMFDDNFHQCSFEKAVHFCIIEKDLDKKLDFEFIVNTLILERVFNVYKETYGKHPFKDIEVKIDEEFKCRCTSLERAEEYIKLAERMDSN